MFLYLSSSSSDSGRCETGNAITKEHSHSMSRFFDWQRKLSAKKRVVRLIFKIFRGNFTPVTLQKPVKCEFLSLQTDNARTEKLLAWARANAPASLHDRQLKSIEDFVTYAGFDVRWVIVYITKFSWEIHKQCHLDLVKCSFYKAKYL